MKEPDRVKRLGGECRGTRALGEGKRQTTRSLPSHPEHSSLPLEAPVSHQRFPTGQDTTTSVLWKRNTDGTQRADGKGRPGNTALCLCFGVFIFQQSQMAIGFIQKTHAKLPSKNNRKLRRYKGFTRLCKKEVSQTILLERIQNHFFLPHKTLIFNPSCFSHSILLLKGPPTLAHSKLPKI